MQRPYKTSNNSLKYVSVSSVTYAISPTIMLVYHFLQCTGLSSTNNKQEHRVCHLRAMQPRAYAWNCTMMSVSLRSRSSSRWANTPARKNTLLCPMRYRFGSSSRASICENEQKLQSELGRTFIPN